LTGFTDKIRARLLFKDSFEFYPTAKTWMYGNHNPTIRGTDEGIWRRVKRIPFDVRIPPEEQDKTLPQKLQAELSGILAWVVRGCAEWQNGGLNPPAAVIASTAQFRADQDTLAAFLLECCLINKLASVTSGELYAAYKKWAEEASLTPLNKIAFSRSLEERGWTTKGPDGKPVRDGRGRAVYSGLGLLQEDPQGA
jgi:putative DNA primase/helicase